ncbi:helix-turn-helix transcriptional regulator [Glutamicibacter sp. 287]|uniref:helix-turn-helix transcriptional regulator n=1 Tax=Glutamicibacter sp. 287 TaxID=3457732 RepID=UPI004034D4C3
MKTAGKIGDNSYAEALAGKTSVSSVVEWMAERLQSALAAPGACGAVIKMGVHAQYQRHIDQAIDHLPGSPEAVRVSCSKFSQKLGLGALLFLVSGSTATDLSSDTEVFHALKRRFSAQATLTPVTVVAEHAHLMDTRSERVLSRLVASGTIKLLLLTNHAEHLGPTFRSLSRQQKLPVFNEYLTGSVELGDYLERRLGTRTSPSIAAHYWAATRGSLDRLASSVECDLAAQRLSLENGSWLLDPARSQETLQDRSNSDEFVQLGTKERELLVRIAGQRYLLASDVARDKESAQSLARLFMLGLVENMAAGRIGLKTPSRQQLIANQRPVPYGMPVGETGHCPVSYEIERIAAGHHLGAIKNLESTTYDSRHQCDVQDCQCIRDLAVYCAKLDIDDVSGAQATLDRTFGAQAVHGRAAQIAASELEVQQWYLDIRAGKIPRVSFNDDSAAGILACLHDARWKDESTRIIGVLCVAYNWQHRGLSTGSKRLVRWALEAFEGSEFFLRDERSTLWMPHIVLLLSYLSLCHQDWRSMDRVDELLARAEHTDETASGFAAYFGALRLLNHGEIQKSRDNFSVLFTPERGTVPPKMWDSYREVQRVLLAMDGHLLSKEIAVASVDHDFDTTTVIRWNAAYTRLLQRAFQEPEESLIADLHVYIDRLLANGQIFSATQAAALCLSLGRPVQKAHMQHIANTGDNDYVHALQLLNNAIESADENAVVEFSCDLASRGLYFHAALPLQRIDKGKTVLRRKLQRSIVSLAAARKDQPVGVHKRQNAAVSSGEHDQWCAPLTSRERSVAVMAAKGLRNAELAEHFGISVRTIEGHLYQIQVKLNLRNRRELRELVANEPQGRFK